MKEEQWGSGGHYKPLRRCTHYARTQGVDISHRGSAIRRLSVAKGCDRGEIARAAEGQRAVGCQPSEWIVAVTEQRDEACMGGGGVNPITVETIRNRVRVGPGSL